jgi:hypothetical protein
MQMTDMLIPINPLYTCTVLPRYIATWYIATLAYRHCKTQNRFPHMLKNPL